MALFSIGKSVKQYKLNWKPSPPDARDLKFSARMPVSIALPTSTDVSTLIPEIYDQGSIGSCTGNAGAMAGLHQSRLQGREISPSRLMLYYDARELEGSTGSDDGAYIRDSFKAWSKKGVCPETIWPYNENEVLTRPNETAYKEGLNTLAEAYVSLNNSLISELKTCIAMGRPFVLGFTVYEKFMYGSWKDTMPMPGNNEQVLGGHAVTAVAYDDTRQAFKIKNSWGVDWKDKGYFWMPYSFIKNTNFCDDFWTLQKITPGIVPVPTPDKITSIVDLKKIFTAAKWINCLRENEVVAIGKEMGLNTDMAKSKKENVSIVAGGLGIS